MKLGQIVLLLVVAHCAFLQVSSFEGIHKSCCNWDGIGRIPWVATINSEIDVIANTSAAIIVNPWLVLINANRILDNSTRKISVGNYTTFTVSANVSLFGDTHAINPAVQTVEVSYIRVHPLYNRRVWTEAEYDIAAVHLKHPLIFDSSVNSVCIPSERLRRKYILNITQGRSTEEVQPVFVSGWSRVVPGVQFLDFTVQNTSFCKNWWENNDETKKFPYIDRFCAFVSKNNSLTNCVHRDNGMIAGINGLYYFIGFVNNFYSNRGVCDSTTLYFGADANTNILTFIETNQICGKRKQWTCSSSTRGRAQCIPYEKFCNGIPDCADGSDEYDGCNNERIQT